MNQAATVRAKGPLVWLDMDQQALDDAYDQAVYAPNRDQVHLRNTFNSGRVRQRLGDNPANVTRMLFAASKPVLDGFSVLSLGFMGGGSPLPPKLREIAILRVGYLSNAAYEVFQHEALARHVGLSEEQIAAIKTGGAAGAVLGEAGAAVLAFTDDLVKNVRAGHPRAAATVASRRSGLVGRGRPTASSSGRSSWLSV